MVRPYYPRTPGSAKVLLSNETRRGLDNFILSTTLYSALRVSFDTMTFAEPGVNLAIFYFPTYSSLQQHVQTPHCNNTFERYHYHHPSKLLKALDNEDNELFLALALATQAIKTRRVKWKHGLNGAMSWIIKGDGTSDIICQRSPFTSCLIS